MHLEKLAHARSLSQLPKNLFENLKKLQHSVLYRNNLKKLDKQFKLKIPQLEVLILAGNPIELDRDFFTELSNLKELRINGCGIESLPDTVFDSLTQLEVLDLSRNKLTVLTENIFAKNLKLREIDLRLNKLKKIKVDFTKLKNIERIDLSRNDCINGGSGYKWAQRALSGLQNDIKSKCQL